MPVPDTFSLKSVRSLHRKLLSLCDFCENIDVIQNSLAHCSKSCGLSVISAKILTSCGIPLLVRGCSFHEAMPASCILGKPSNSSPICPIDSLALGNCLSVNVLVCLKKSTVLAIFGIAADQGETSSCKFSDDNILSKII